MTHHTDRTRMEGRKVMDWQAIWYILAGFVLGFATSTLWEWLYYRRQRLRAGVREVDAGPYTLLPGHKQPVPAQRPPPAEHRSPAEYRSPGVFLESERPDSASAEETPVVQAASWEAVRFPVRTARGETPPAIGRETPPDERYFETPRAYEQELAPEFAEDVEEDVEEDQEPDATPPLPATSAVAVALPAAGSQPVDDDEQREADAGAVPPSAPIAGTLKPALPGQEDALIADAPPMPVVEDGVAPAAPRPPGHPDNFARIKGIGRAYRQRLYHAGITTWQQLVDSEAEVLRKATRAMANANIENWQAQAQALMEQYNREGATYHGPPPDDLTAIPGIGPTTMDILYRAGICTYGQLAAATPEQLRDLLPAPAVGVEVDYERWIGLAERLAGDQMDTA